MRSNIGAVSVVLSLFALCCGGPLLIGALLATGLGARLLASGGPALAGAALLAAAVAAVWLRQRGWRFSRARDADCCAPTTLSRPEVRR